MKAISPLVFSSILFASACSSPSQDQTDVQSPVAASLISSAFTYQCESGETITATYPSTEAATVQYKRSTYDMQIAVSASGARYVGGELEWWTKGPEGTLFGHNPDGTSGEIIEVCEES